MTGGQIADYFGGIGYGWDRDVIPLVLAVLFRAGSIEITCQGRRYRNYQEPQARTPLTNNTAFKSASFAPRESIDLKTLTSAVKSLEDMLGREVDVEESAIAEEFQKLARVEKEGILPALALAQAHWLPVAERLRDWSETLDTVLSSQPDDCVRMLSGEGKSLRELRESAQRVRAFLTPANLEVISQARSALDGQVPILRTIGQVDEIESQAQSLREILEGPDLPERFAQVSGLAQAVDAAYWKAFDQRRRLEEYTKAIAEAQAEPEFAQVEEAQRESILAPLRRRAVASLDRRPFASADAKTGATARTLEEDLGLLPALRAGALEQLRQAVRPPTRPEEGLEVIRLSDFLPRS